ncbi:MAG: ThuA domain-containing protein [Pirellulaceae bacterium]|nr:ThuA domain-containing protein [Pirellulaceae bacterium]
MMRLLRTLLVCICFVSSVIVFAMCHASSMWAADHWVSYQGKHGPGQGKHIVFVTGDDEYRSEEAMPMLAKILAIRHGFRCTVLFAIHPEDGTITPDYQQNIPGTSVLDDADLMVLFTRFRELPDEQMKPIVDYANSGKPMIGLRTSTHAFNYGKNKGSVYAKYSFDSKDPSGGFGQLVLGDTWVNHHGHHGSQSTRGVINEAFASHPIVQGCEDVWGPSDVYGIIHLPENAKVVLWGQVIDGMKAKDPPIVGKQNNPMMPLAWMREYAGDTGKNSRVFCTTMGASVDFQSAGLRRLFANACYWCLEMEQHILQSANVDYVDPYRPSFFGFGAYQKGLKPADFALGK